MFQTDLLSISRSLNTVYTAVGICHASYVDCLLADSQIWETVLLIGFYYKKICVGFFIVCLLSFIVPVKIESHKKFWGGVVLLFLFNKVKLMLQELHFDTSSSGQLKCHYLKSLCAVLKLLIMVNYCDV